jgi:hypothetical protein
VFKSGRPIERHVEILKLKTALTLHHSDLCVQPGAAWILPAAIVDIAPDPISALLAEFANDRTRGTPDIGDRR